jgi:CTD small phosphatase-like protein 2
LDDPYIKKPPVAKFVQNDKSKMTLVLDLDETLVHCSTEPLSGSDLVFPVVFNGIEYKV